jgi:hypothetical protein
MEHPRLTRLLWLNTFEQIERWESLLLAGGPDELITLGQVPEALIAIASLKASHPHLAVELEPLFKRLSNALRP